MSENCGCFVMRGYSISDTRLGYAWDWFSKEIIGKCRRPGAAVELSVIFNQGFLSCNDAER